MKNHFGERLKELRKSRNLSQIKLAVKLAQYAPKNGFSQTYVSTLEHRELPPRGETLRVLSDFFGVDASYFYSSVNMENLQISDNSRKIVFKIERLLRIFLEAQGSDIEAIAIRKETRGMIEEQLDFLEMEIGKGKQNFDHLRSLAQSIVNEDKGE